MKFSKVLVFLAAYGGENVLAQQAGTIKKEVHPEITYQTCTSKGCTDVQSSLVIDSNWRWTEADGENCYTDTMWTDQCSGNDDAAAAACSEKCALEGASDDYESVYGIRTDGNSLNLTYVTVNTDAYSSGTNVGSRLYLMNGDDKYQMFKLKNKEFSIDVDDANIGCGLNGAVYFVEMEEDGGKSNYKDNKAGAEFGTGYCDAQCPHDIKYIAGEANLIDWQPADEGSGTGMGKYGTCCTEMDIFEANNMAYSYTPHVCTNEGPLRCNGTECGDINDDDPSSRYNGVCDKDGCDFAPYRLGNTDFYGVGSDFTIDTSKKFTVVTQFITEDGTDDGDLIEIKRFFVQDGKTVENPTVDIDGQKFSSVTDDFCKAEKAAFGDTDAFTKNGGLKAMGDSMDRGMVLVLSLWDDNYANMLWLDATYPVNSTDPGALRGPCDVNTGDPTTMRDEVPNSSVAYSNIKFGEIGSTFSM